MDITFDITPIYAFFNLPADIVLKKAFWLFGWIPIAIAFLWGVKEIWLWYIRRKWYAKFKFILLAVDIPRGNEQTPKAVENIFSYLLGAHSVPNLVEKYWEGVFQLYFSLEIVSIDGYTQFLIWTPDHFRNLVESAVYSQYPDAEITEVNNYTEGMPTRFPDDEYDIWGVEFTQAKKKVYPIKTYKEFEHQMGATNVQYKDPMATLMDLCSSLRKGEQLWYQILITPLGFDWTGDADKEVSKILKETTVSTGGQNIADKIVNGILYLIGELSEIIFSIWSDIGEKSEEKKEDALKMINLKPKEKKQVEAIQNKDSKLSFESKIRFVYLAKKDVMNKPKAVNGFVGYIKQFATLDLNNLTPDMEKTGTSTAYFFKESRLNGRKNRIVRNYINRDNWAGKKPGILNIEELASLWHFPLEAVVKAPLIQKAPGRKAEPPMALPFGDEAVKGEMLEPIAGETAESKIDSIFTPLEKKPLISSDIKSHNKVKLPTSDILLTDPIEARPSFATADVKFEDKKESVEKKGAPPENLPVA